MTVEQQDRNLGHTSLIFCFSSYRILQSTQGTRTILIFDTTPPSPSPSPSHTLINHYPADQ